MLFKEIGIRERRIHFIGIGGIGMSGIAEILLNLGYAISGSDLQESAVTQRLRGLGAAVSIGHRADNVGGAEAVVVSSAISDYNVELMEARRRKIPVIFRGELLAELMRLKYGIAVGGSHGKTTTSSITASVLSSGGKDPTVVVGGRVDAIGSNARLGNSDFLLVEADESDGSFLHLDPIVAVVTNIDREHLDHYHTVEALTGAFVQFVNKVPFYGTAIVCIDDPHVKLIVPMIERRYRTYGIEELSPEADLVADEIALGRFESSFRLRYSGEDLGKFEIRGVGMHTVRNAMAAVLVGLEVDIPVEKIRAGLAAFSGVDRRFQKRGEAAGVTVIDDYGHHPTEIRATLQAARNCAFEGINVIFQPHRYSRTHLMLDEFAECFADCARLWVVDIYSAGEKPLPGVNSAQLVEKIAAAGHPAVEYCESIDDAVRRAVAQSRAGEAVITLGAGSIWRYGERILEGLEAAEGEDKQTNALGVRVEPKGSKRHG